MLARLRRPAWRRFGRWSRGLGIVFLGSAAFVPLPTIVVIAFVVAGLLLFAIGGLAWLARDTDAWRR